jgi:molybdopterin-guanine dinucleotide biosynthesis protein A
LAVDMPRAGADTFVRLREALPGHDAAVLVDRGGRRQPLCGVYLRGALDRVRPASPQEEHGLPMRRLLTALTVAEVPASGEEAHDVDTWEDLALLRDVTREEPDPGLRGGPGRTNLGR